jgi:GntR family transcriptional regulator
MLMVPLNKDLPTPLYHQLKLALMSAIESGQWEAGQQLPNEGKLAESFGVSKITVRQALQELADLGYVRREQGRGTFVSKPKLDQGPRELTSFSEEMRRHRLKPSSRVLEKHVTKAGQRAAEALQLREEEPVFVLKRLRIAEDEPMGVQTAHIPLSLVPGLLDEDLENVSLYEVLQNRYSLYPAKARETYFAVPVEESAAELLGIAAGSPVFAVERVTLLASGKPFEFVQSVMRGDRYSVILELAADRMPQAIREGGTQ